jgi:Uma2 family endonuclease
VLRLAILLDQACPPDLEVMIAPFDVVLAEHTVVEPDLLLARRADLTDKDLPVPLLLAVEVLSPSTRRFDLLLKRDRYEAAGCPSYWVVDPGDASSAPALRAWELTEGRYVEVADVVGEETWRSSQPYAVTVTPAALVR